jgi:spore germination protein YaaH
LQPKNRIVDFELFDALAPTKRASCAKADAALNPVTQRATSADTHFLTKQFRRKRLFSTLTRSNKHKAQANHSARAMFHQNLKRETAMKLIKTTLLVATLAAASAAFADPGMAGNHVPGERIVKLLNLDANRAAQVTAIMTEQRSQGKALWEANKGNTDPAARQAARDQMKALHEQTKAKLATVLTPDELAKLKEARKAMRHGGHGPKQG